MRDDLIKTIVNGLAEAQAKTALSILFHAVPGLSSVLDGDAVIIAIDDLREAERQSRQACLTPPDGGSPTDRECDIAAKCGDIIRDLANRAIIEGGAP